MRPAPRVSVVIPTYNVESFLAITIESVLQQTVSDLEIVLFDDGSSDATVRIAEEYAARDPRITLGRGNHGGAAAARNGGFMKTHPNSEFVLFCDSDDVLESDAIETLIAALEAHPENPAAHGLCRTIDSAGVQFPHDDHAESMRIRVAVVGDRFERLADSAPTSFAALLVKNYITTPGTSLIRRSALEAVGPFEQALAVCEDWDMNLRLARLGDFVFVDKILLNWRRHDNAISNVSKRWRSAYLKARRRTIFEARNTSVQRQAACFVLCNEVARLQHESVRNLRAGQFRDAVRNLGKSLLLRSAFVPLPRPLRF